MEDHLAEDHPFPLVFQRGRRGRRVLYVDLPGLAHHARRDMPTDSPSGPAGSVKVVDFVLFGQSFVAMSAGPLDPFNHAVFVRRELR
jgi:predicted 3-demethylubiquinone-9 3-methyltransferase (glyoxalase superfamily)